MKRVSYGNIAGILIKYLNKGHGMIVRFVLTIVLETAFTITAPLIIRKLTNSYTGDAPASDFYGILFLILVLTGCYLLCALMKFINLRTANSFGGLIVKNMRIACCKKIDRLPLKFLDSHATGDILSRVTSDLSTVYDALQSTVITVVSAVTTVTSMIVIMIVIKWQLALVFVILIPILYCLVFFIAKKTRRRYGAQREILGKLNGYVNDICENHLLMESFDFRREAEAEFEEMNRDFMRMYISGNFQSGFIIPMNTLINNIAYIAVCVVGATLMAWGMLDLGGLQAFLFYIGMIDAPNRALAFNLVSLQNGMAAVERIVEFLEEAEMPVEETAEILSPGSGIRGAVEFDHVQFGYDPAQLLMKDVNFRVKPGMKVAVVGPSGAGKTTLVNLLMRFYEISAGSIRIDGVDTAYATLDSIHSCLGMVLQDSWIFKGSIYENIAYGRLNATEDEIRQVARMTGCASFIEKLPMGYETIISSEETLLSEGQLQLLCIARVALANPPVLILDEATSQVDTQTETLIMRAIEGLMHGKTSFIIAHRLYTIQNADLILYMENGDILESGTHDELMAKKGRYASMFRAGFDD